MQKHVYIYKPIGNSNNALEEDGITLQDIVDQIGNAKKNDKIIVHINSPGGDVREGFAIYDYLKTRGVETVIEGRCYSIASVIALAGKVRKMMPNAEVLIHNPWGQPEPGDADKIREYANLLDHEEEKLRNFYAEQLSIDASELDQWMKQEKRMTATIALEMGFITEIVKESKAVAYIKPEYKKEENSKVMSEIKSLKKAFQVFLDKFNIKNETPDVKALDLSLASGDMITVDTEGSEPAVGDVVTVSGETPEDGSYTLADGRTLVVAAGVITEIIEAEEATMEALKAKLEASEKENATLKAKIDTQDEEMKTIKDKLNWITENVEPAQLKNVKRETVFNKKPVVSEVVDFKAEMQERRKNYKVKKQILK